MITRSETADPYMGNPDAARYVLRILGLLIMVVAAFPVGLFIGIAL